MVITEFNSGKVLLRQLPGALCHVYRIGGVGDGVWIINLARRVLVYPAPVCGARIS